MEGCGYLPLARKRAGITALHGLADIWRLVRHVAHEVPPCAAVECCGVSDAYPDGPCARRLVGDPWRSCAPSPTGLSMVTSRRVPPRLAHVDLQPVLLVDVKAAHTPTRSCPSGCGGCSSSAADIKLAQRGLPPGPPQQWPREYLAYKLFFQLVTGGRFEDWEAA